MAGRGEGSYYQGYKWCRPATRWAIYWRDRCRATDNLRCLWCGVTASVEEVYNGKLRLSLDHLDPWSAGGDNSAENLVTCCLKCNARRGDLDYETTALGDLFEPYAYSRINLCRRLELDRDKGKALYAAKPRREWRKPALVLEREMATRVVIPIEEPDENGLYADGCYAA